MNGETSLSFENDLEVKPLCRRNTYQERALELGQKVDSDPRRSSASAVLSPSYPEYRLCLLRVLLDLTGKGLLSCCAPGKPFSEKTSGTPLKFKRSVA